jgi:hypothetical protein
MGWQGRGREFNPLLQRQFFPKNQHLAGSAKKTNSASTGRTELEDARKSVHNPCSLFPKCSDELTENAAS